MTQLKSATLVIRILAAGVAAASSFPLNSVLAHEGHQMECSEASINAMKADIQAMPDGKSKTTATNETKAAQDMMRKKDMKGCTAHLHTAMDAMEK